MRKIITITLLIILGISCKQNTNALQHNVTVVNEEVSSKKLSKIFSENVLEPNIVYYTSDTLELKLDLWLPAKRLGEDPWVTYGDKLKPVILNIHGGKWIYGDKTTDTFDMMHYIDKGWSVVNINYRFTNEAPLPLPILDCRRALNWIYENAEKYKFDTNNIVVSGNSSGGHYALMTGILNTEKDQEIFGTEFKNNLKVKAIINWYGQYYFHKAKDWNGEKLFWETEEFLLELTGKTKNAQHILDVSTAINHLHEDMPPIISIHGDIDPVVPYSQSVRLHKDLDSLGIVNKLVTIKDGKHHNFSTNDLTNAYSEIFKFLKELDD